MLYNIVNINKALWITLTSLTADFSHKFVLKSLAILFSIPQPSGFFVETIWYLVCLLKIIYMSKSEFKDSLDRTSEIELTVRGRKSGQDISRPVWFVHENNTLYLLPVQGSDTNWYKNVLKDPIIKISIDRLEISRKAKPISDSNKVKDVVDKFKSKYSNSEVQKYYTKLDVAAEVALQQE